MYKVLLVLLSAGTCLIAEEFDARLSIHTIVREDIFAGFLENDMDRLAKGEKKIDVLLQQRPKSRESLLAWKAGASVYRAIRAHELKQPAEFQRHYADALELYRQANAPGPTFGVAVLQAATYSIMADRLPEAQRAPAWNESYVGYRVVYRDQEKILDKLPLHIKGELLAGLAMSAQRVGKDGEAAEWIERILTSMPNTAYAARAMTWKNKPELARSTGLTCQGCHNSGRLAARQTALAQ